MTPVPSSSPRTLADELRARADTDLAGLLHARPDLLSPLPGDLSQLATRAGTRASVQRALDRLDAFTLQTAETLAMAGPPCRYDDLAALLPGAEHRLPQAVATLRSHALLWGGQDTLRLVRTAQELLAPTPQRPGATGLGPSLTETVGALSPRRAQELLAANGLPGTADPVGAARALAAHLSDRDRLTVLLQEAPDRAHEVLERLVWGPPYGEVSAQPAAHLRWLLDHALLVPTAPGTVVLPREVALTLRDGRAHRRLCAEPPELTPRAVYAPGQLDTTAAGQAHLALGITESLLALWEREPPAVLRTGGLGVRDLKRTAVGLDVPEPEAAFWAELAYAAGLVAGDGENDERYAPTPASDDWLRGSPGERWAHLVGAWLTGTRVPALIGERAPQSGAARGRGGERTLAALGPGLDRGPAAELRGRVLGLLAEVEPGTAPEPMALRERLRWLGPRRMPDDLRELLCSSVLTEAEHLGVTARGALAGYARPLIAAGRAAPAPAPVPALSATTGVETAGVETAEREAAARESAGGDGPGPESPGPYAGTDADAAADTDAEIVAAAVRSAEALRPVPVDERAAAASAAELLTPLLPQPLDHFLLQADMTAVAPGPLLRELARTLAAAADVESTGGATVYRFTPASVRRALDAGWSAAELQMFLSERSSTPVPQPLSYLVDDVARRHGRLRAGTAAGYLTCDDETTLDHLLADSRLEPLRLRRIAPTVVICPVGGEELLDRLRECGYAPSAEGDGGTSLHGPAEPRRTPPRSAPDPVPDGPPPDQVRARRQPGDH
uniref:helicase-associated domain-containing protein n=2 Tax=unclassified Streptomyces TaxID=2593676 RepID=UPI000CD58ACD